MTTIKRVFLFILTNLAIICVVTIIFMIIQSVFGVTVTPYIGQGYGSLVPLLIFSAIFGFGGALISLAISRWIAKWTYSIRLLNQAHLLNYSEKEQTVYMIVEMIARQNHISMPEVGVYESDDPNAFATGATRNSALVAVSTGLLAAMTRDEIEGVIGHEMSHILNGDMVTMTLLQGVLNTFVIFLARVIGYIVDTMILRDEDGNGFGYMIIVFILQTILGILASLILMAFSRHREYRADAGSAQILGRDRMIRALRRLKLITEHMEATTGDDHLATMKIAGHG